MNSINTSSMMSIMMTPQTSNIAKDIVSQSDTDSDSSLSIDELGISEELFSSLDSDGDSLVTQNEIASAIDSKLSQYDSMPSKEEFSSLLSELGLEMPEPPENSVNSEFASQLMSAYDSDGDSSLSSEEVSLLSEDEFSALDTDGDGSITTEELTSAIDEVFANSSMPPPQSATNSEFASQLMSAYDSDGDSSLSAEEVSQLTEDEFSALDADGDGSITTEELTSAINQVASSSETAPPPPPSGGTGGGGGSSESEDEETYSDLDTNEDGVVSQEELAAAYGLDDESEDETYTSSEDSSDNIKMLFDAIKQNSEDNEESLDLSNFSNIMKMFNNQNNNSQLNTYVNNITPNSNFSFGYAYL